MFIRPHVALTVPSQEGLMRSVTSTLLTPICCKMDTAAYLRPPDRWTRTNLPFNMIRYQTYLRSGPRKTTILTLSLIQCRISTNRVAWSVYNRWLNRRTAMVHQVPRPQRFWTSLLTGLDLHEVCLDVIALDHRYRCLQIVGFWFRDFPIACYQCSSEQQIDLYHMEGLFETRFASPGTASVIIMVINNFYDIMIMDDEVLWHIILVFFSFRLLVRCCHNAVIITFHS